MINSHSSQDASFSEFRLIRLAITKQAKHIGIIVRIKPDQAPRLLHLGFHHDLRYDELASVDHWETNYAWLDFSGFSDREMKQLAVWMETIWNVNWKNVPYGVAYSGAGYFDSVTGKFISSHTGRGLTCATFVMAMFEDFLFPIVEWGSWPQRSSDQGFLTFIIGKLDDFVAQGKAEAAHVDAQKAALGIAPRYRPGEVAVAGAAYLGDPINFVTSELLSRPLSNDLASI